MNIIACKVNHLKNPLGYHMEHVTFSYVVEQAKWKKADSCTYSCLYG